MRYDLLTPRPKKDGGTHWHKVGAAFPRDKGGFSLVFDSLPLPDDKGRVSVLMAEPRQDDRQQHANSGPQGYQAPPQDQDEIPF